MPAAPWVLPKCPREGLSGSIHIYIKPSALSPPLPLAHSILPSPTGEGEGGWDGASEAASTSPRQFRRDRKGSCRDPFRVKMERECEARGTSTADCHASSRQLARSRVRGVLLRGYAGGRAAGRAAAPWRPAAVLGPLRPRPPCLLVCPSPPRPPCKAV